MGLFKRKPKPDVMGFICCETSIQRIKQIEEMLGHQQLSLEVYAFSTGVIQRILDLQYTSEVIEQTFSHCDRFMFKKQKDWKAKEAFIQQLRQSIQAVDFKEEEQLQALVQNTMDSWHTTQDNIRQELLTWCHTQLLISTDIKSK